MRTLSIVGAGCSGTLVAVHLLREFAPPEARVLLFERRGSFGPGVAYGTEHPEHRLNVPAGCMSAFDEQPLHFLEWVHQSMPEATAGCFLPRHVFGAYLSSLLAAAARAGAERGVALDRRAEAVTALRRGASGGFRLETNEGRTEDVDAAVLALGNLPPMAKACSAGSLTADPSYVADPWSAGALDVDPDAPVLLLGTGLTMLDVAVALQSARHRGPIYALSRRGLVPQPHRSALPGPPARSRPGDIDAWPRTARGLLRAVRREVERAASRGRDWREVMASLRSDTPRLWRSLPLREQRRFLEHLRPWWDTHRHRSAPRTGALVAALRARGGLVVLAGRVTGTRREGGWMRVDLRLRNGAIRSLAAARIVDCTGPCADVARAHDPLLSTLVCEGLARRDALRLGLDADDEGALIDADGHPQQRLFTLGPLRKGRLWECTAVPEIRVQAAALAARVAPLLESQ